MTQPAEVALAMDWGGTWSRIAVADGQGEILWQSRRLNDPDSDRERLIGDSEDLIRQAVEWCGERAIAGLGIAVGGPVDAPTGALMEPNLPALNGVSLPALWAPLLGRPVYVGNDANLAALGEFRYGAGLAARRQGNAPRTLVYVTVSTGIGGGVIEQERMFLGAHGQAVEVGHMVIDRSSAAPRCRCGRGGCLESLASGTAIARIARLRAAEPGAGDSPLAGPEAAQITSERVFEAAGQGDPLALDIVNGAVQALAVGFTNILHLYNPDLLALGGGVTSGLINLGLLPQINALMLESAMTEGHRDIRLEPSRLGDAAGMLGAASLVWDGAGRGGG